MAGLGLGRIKVFLASVESLTPFGLCNFAVLYTKGKVKSKKHKRGTLKPVQIENDNYNDNYSYIRVHTNGHYVYYKHAVVRSSLSESDSNNISPLCCSSCDVDSTILL